MALIFPIFFVLVLNDNIGLLSPRHRLWKLQLRSLYTPEQTITYIFAFRRHSFRCFFEIFAMSVSVQNTQFEWERYLKFLVCDLTTDKCTKRRIDSKFSTPRVVFECFTYSTSVIHYALISLFIFLPTTHISV